MTELLGLVLVSCVFGLAVHKWGFPKCALILILLSAAVVPRNLTQEVAFRHIGIASPMPRPTTYLVTVGVTLLGTLFMARTRRGAWTWVPFVVSLVASASLVWAGGPVQDAGLIQLLLAPAAWIVGMSLSTHLAADGGRFLIRAVALVVFLQLAVCLLQTMGIQVNPMEATQEAILGSRANGTLGHPTTSEKSSSCYLLCCFLLAARLIGLTPTYGRQQ